MPKIIKKIANQFEEYFSVLLFISLIILCLLQILFRFVFNFSLSWTEELARYIFILLVYVAASLAITRHAHVRVEIIDGLLKGFPKYILDQLIDIIWCLFMVYLGYYGVIIAFEALAVEQVTPALGWQIGWIYMIIPGTFLLMSIRLLQNIILRAINRKNNHVISDQNDYYQENPS